MDCYPYTQDKRLIVKYRSLFHPYRLLVHDRARVLVHDRARVLVHDMARVLVHDMARVSGVQDPSTFGPGRNQNTSRI